MNNNISFLIFLFFLIFNTAYAKQIKITSDKLEIMRINNISIFSGNVYALEDNLEMWSEELIITSSKDQKTIREITAQSNVKILREGLSINGDEARYDPINNELFVFGDVKVTQNKNIILCDEIIVDLENSSSIMKSESTKRVKASIFTKEYSK